MSQTLAPPDLLSTGRLCEILQVGPNELRRRLDAMRLSPALFLNGIPYYEASVIQALRALPARARHAR
jgi:hypothetical protein